MNDRATMKALSATPILLLLVGDFTAFASRGASEPPSRRSILSRPPTKRGKTKRTLSPARVSSNAKFSKEQSTATLLPRRRDDDSVVIPIILRPWIYLYRAIPKVYMPFTKLDVTFTIASTLLLTGVDMIAGEFLCAMGWPRGTKQTRAVAGSLCTIFHSTVLVSGLGACLLTQNFTPSGKMDAHPDWWRDAATALIQFCTGYMIYDSLVQFIAARWVPGSGPVLSATDWMFLGHHAATAVYMTSARLAEAGHLSAMILMFLGEFTAPIMNVFRITRHARDIEWDCVGGPMLRALQPYIEYVFSALFVAFRVFAGPACAIHLTYDLILTKQGRQNVPLGLSIFWLVMCWGVLIGSFPWIQSALGTIKGGIPNIA